MFRLKSFFVLAVWASSPETTSLAISKHTNHALATLIANVAPNAAQSKRMWNMAILSQSPRRKSSPKKASEPAPSAVKNKTAGGHYRGGNDGYGDGYGHENHGYGGHHNGGYDSGYGHGKSNYGGGNQGYGYGYRQHRLVDDFICDLDPSMLVVTNSRNYVQKGYGHEKKQYGSKDGYDNKDNYGGKNEGHGYGDKSDYGHPKTKEYGNSGYNKGGYGQEGYGHNEGHGEGYGHGHGDGYGNEGGYGNDNYGHHQAVAHRLRCSKIAIRNDSDCTTCCQLAARRDRSVSKDSIIGFIVDYDQIQHSYGSNHGSGYRKKDDYGTNDGYGRKKRDAAPPGIKPLGEGAQRSTNYEQGGNQPAYNKEGYENKGQDYGKEEYGDNKGGYEKKEGYGGEGYVNNDYGYMLHRPPVPYFPPYNPRCVCCAPKRHHNHNHGNGYGNNHHNKGYGHVRGYGNNHNDGYGHNEGYGQGNGYGGHNEYNHEGDHGYGGGHGGPGHGYGNDGYSNGYEGGRGYGGGHGGSYDSHGGYGGKNEGYDKGYEGGEYEPHNKDHYGGGDYKFGA